MPGPGNKKAKPRPKPQQTPGSCKVESKAMEVEAYVGRVDHADGWEMVVDILCSVFDLPDLSTRRGLKKVHSNFDSIYRRLEAAYEMYPGSVRLRGGIVGIYARMCVDAILRNKLMDRGILKKLIPLLDIDSTRYLALRALATITHHGGEAARLKIAEHSAVLTRLAESFPDDQTVTELALTVLSHCVSAAIEPEHPPNARLRASLDMRAILKVASENLRKEWATTILIEHAASLLAASTLNAAETFKSYPPAIQALVAGLRSKDWIMRCTCLGGLIRLHYKGAEHDMVFYDPSKFIASIHSFPGHLKDIMMDYGLPNCELYVMMQTQADFQKAMFQCVQDHDFCALGMKLGGFVLRTEFSIPDGCFQEEDPRTGHRKVSDVGLPFTMWRDALPYCAKALRRRGAGAEADTADVLDIKYLVMKQKVGDAVAIAKKGLTRNPGFAYFHYAITLSANNVDGLRAAKKGLRCKNLTRFLQFQLLQRAVEHSAELGIVTLNDAKAATDEAKWEEGIAFLMSAYEDAKTFVREAPPDNRHRLSVGYWYILLTVTIRESLSPDLRELRDAIDGLKQAEDFFAAVGVKPPKTNLRLAQDTVVKVFPAAIVQYGNVFAKPHPVRDDKQDVPPEKLRDDLAAWLEGTHLDDEDEEQRLDTKCLHPNISSNHVDMYRCSWCRNTSAALRKCSGCSKTRYCDSDCQRAHWADHKKTCTNNTKNR